MGESKHTPGPWVVWEPETDTGSGSDERATGIVIGKSRRDMMQEIATVNCDGFYTTGELQPVKSGLLRKQHWPKAPADAIANARLIAAAPDLLAALQELLRVDDEWHGAVNSEMANARRVAREAIAKAAAGDVACGRGRGRQGETAL